jgi:hypothetical protein
MQGHRFVATVLAQHISGNADIDYMDDEPRKLLPLDAAESWFASMRRKDGT